VQAKCLHAINKEKMRHCHIKDVAHMHLIYLPDKNSYQWLSTCSGKFTGLLLAFIYHYQQLQQCSLCAQWWACLILPLYSTTLPHSATLLMDQFGATLLPGTLSTKANYYTCTNVINTITSI